MNETPKSPCRGCDYEFDNKKDEPCSSCPKPGEYDDALKKTFFPIRKFLRTSTPLRTDRKGLKNINAPSLEQRPKTKEDEPMPIPVDGAIVDSGASEEVKNNTKPKIIQLLDKYCAEEGISVKQVTSKSRAPLVAAARQRIAITLFEREGIDYRTIAAVMKKSPSAVWAWFNTGIDNNSDRLVEKILHEMPETLKKLKVIAKRDIRTPLDQIRFIIREHCGV